MAVQPRSSLHSVGYPAPGRMEQRTLVGSGPSARWRTLRSERRHPAFVLIDVDLAVCEAAVEDLLGRVSRHPSVRSRVRDESARRACAAVEPAAPLRARRRGSRRSRIGSCRPRSRDHRFGLQCDRICSSLLSDGSAVCAGVAAACQAPSPLAIAWNWSEYRAGGWQGNQAMHRARDRSFGNMPRRIRWGVAKW